MDTEERSKGGRTVQRAPGVSVIASERDVLVEEIREDRAAKVCVERKGVGEDHG